MGRACWAVLAVLALVAGACSGGDDDDDRASPSRATTSTTSTTAAAETTTTAPAPTTTTSLAAVVAPVRPAPGQPAISSPPASVACPAVPARRAPRADRPAYDWSLQVDLPAGAVTGRGTLAFTPDADTDRVVLRLWANSPRITRAGGRIEAAVDGETPFEQPDATTLVLKVPVKAGERFQTGLTFRLTLPTSPSNDRVYRSGDAVRLGSFLPILAWEPGMGWATDPPTSGFAEASTSVPADFTVTVAGLPDGVTALATGVAVPDRPDTYAASGVPDWAMSTGRFTSESREVAGVRVTVGVDSQVREGPRGYLDRVAQAIQRFSSMYGPYPWPSYTLAITPALGGGIEYPMHVMQGPGTIGRTTSHEVAHMWFYGLVASNQGRDPWIDEGLATWAEGRFEGTTAALMARDIPAAGQGRAGEPMTFWETRQSAYYRSVYVQGAQAIGALGPADAVDCALRHLVATQAYEVADSREVAAALATVFPNARDVLARFGIRSA
ncbi:MAG TPA: hypothetical protein VF230_05600 [Acidimicrobiales bacterium]